MIDETLMIEDIGCPSYEIAAYIDGELDLSREMEFELHLTKCDLCSVELNRQKHFLCTLNASLMQENDIELPPDFAKKIVVSAESEVSGLRRPRERFNAVFICVTLSLFTLFAVGAGSGAVFGGISSTFEQIAAVGGFFGHIVYSFLVGVVVVLRAVAVPFQYGIFTVIAVIGGITVVSVLVSAMKIRLQRT